MKLTIDNFDNFGAVDSTPWIDAGTTARIVRRLNRPSELRCRLVAVGPQFVVPVKGARVTLARSDGTALFTGYINAPPEYEYLGWGEAGPAYRYSLSAASDELLLDRKMLPERAPFVARPAGEMLRELADDAMPGALDYSEVQALDVVPSYSSDPRKTWSEHAAELALRARASYRVLDGKLVFEALGARQHSVPAEASEQWCPEELKLRSPDSGVNDLTVSGRMEPRLYVKDYFLGDGITLDFSLSHAPFTSFNQYLADEEFKGTALNPRYWEIADPGSAISVGGGALQVQGGTGQDGQTAITFAEWLELGGALTLRHGEVSFTAASDGIIGGLYAGAVSVAGCLAGFRITPAGAASTIRAIVNGVAVGASITTIAGHRYSLTTPLFASEIFRMRQIFHSSSRPAGNGRGGDTVAADVRVVLEVHDIDPGNPGSQAAPSTVLYDDVITAAPALCRYVLVNAIDMHAAVAFTQLLRVPEAEVRTALPNAAFRTRLLGALADGAECALDGSSALFFYPDYVPAAGERIEVRYRSRAPAVARVTDAAAAAALACGPDNGVRAGVRHIAAPAARTGTDCENAALALLDDGAQQAWAGEYESWSDFFPGAGDDVFPGEAIAIDAPSRGADFAAIVREVGLETTDFGGEQVRYKVRFANDAAEPLGFAFEPGTAYPPEDAVGVSDVGVSTIADLPQAEITSYTSTTVAIDAGSDPPAGGGIEVRRTDHGWSTEDDRNLIARLTTRSFTVPRLSRTQDYYLRQYDASSPRRYSRYSTALHLDYPY